MKHQKIQSKRVLVTGGAGITESNLCEDLLKFNNEEVCLDNFSTGYRENIIPFLSNPNCQFKMEAGAKETVN